MPHGGYARELALPDVKSDVAKLTRTIVAGEPMFELPMRWPYLHTPGREWFAGSSCDPIIVTPAAPRPRR